MTERKLRLADAGNTTNPALRVILAKGFQVYFLPNDNDRDYGDFWAIKEG